MTRTVLVVLLASVVLMYVTSTSASGESDQPPNIVLIYVDDLGYGDLSCYGNTSYTTPYLDRMAAEGTRFTDFYVAQPVCSASRAALLTGCYPNRIGITGDLGPGAHHGLNANETTLAELCKSQGYATAVFGKWHLGHRAPFLPGMHGFDEFNGIPYSNDMWPLHPDYVDLPPDAAGRKRGYPDLPIFEGDTIINPTVQPDDQREFTATARRAAIDFIEQHADEPFFVYVPHPMPHVPLFVSTPFEGRSAAGLYGDVITEIDASVGAIIETLERLELDDNTLVIFASDNGPWLNYGDHAGATGPLREGKGTTFEGGVRVPCIMRWPGQVTAGRACSEPMMTIDILPTIARLIGAPLPSLRIDGRDATDLVLDRPGARSPQEAYFFYYHRNNLEAVRAGRWKLHLPHTYRSMVGQTPGSGGRPGSYNWSARTELALFDLETDIGETTNVISKHPDVLERLLRLVETMRSDLGDALVEAKPSGRREPGRVPKADP